jgi:hypothetical protein
MTFQRQTPMRINLFELQPSIAQAGRNFNTQQIL